MSNVGTSLPKGRQQLDEIIYTCENCHVTIIH